MERTDANLQDGYDKVKHEDVGNTHAFSHLPGLFHFDRFTTVSAVVGRSEDAGARPGIEIHAARSIGAHSE